MCLMLLLKATDKNKKVNSEFCRQLIVGRKGQSPGRMNMIVYYSLKEQLKFVFASF